MIGLTSQLQRDQMEHNFETYCTNQNVLQF
jgi:hypothetical protein